MDPDTDLEALFSDLIRFETELWDAIDARLRGQFGLPLTHFEPMRIMAQRASCRVFDIADELSITVGGVSKLVDRIEAAGYCVRLPNPVDRRSSIIDLTPEGRRMLAAASVAFREELRRRVAAALPPEEVTRFAETLAVLRAASAATPAVRPGG